jgi:hypothetical protein
MRPRPMRFESLILAIGAVSTVALAATGALGYRGLAGGTAGLAPHVALAVAAVLGVLFSHLWVLFFLLGTGRGLRRVAAGDEALADLALARRWAFAALSATLGILLALVASGATAYTRPDVASAHAGLFWIVLALQVSALAIEWRTLRANAALLAALDRGPGR